MFCIIKAYERLKDALFSMMIACFVMTIVPSLAQPTPEAQNVINRNIPKPIPESPNVASLGKFGDYQVSHFTGLPDITIPIFEVKSGELTVPITLSYHASGVKPTDIASWVGLGWSLSAGGQMSVSINGKADEYSYLSNQLKDNLAVCGGPGVGTFYYLNDVSKGTIDGEPDIFSYSFPGKSGKFIIPYSGVPYLIPYAPIVVQRSSGIYEITDENGVYYKFGGNDSEGNSATELTAAYHGGNPSVNGTTAWYLVQMKAPNTDDQINYTFQNVGTTNTFDVAYTYTLMDLCTASNGATCPTTVFSPQISNITSTTVQRAIKSIYFETGRVDFVLSTADRSDISGQVKSLDRIEIFSNVNGSYIKQKTIQFSYSYFTDQGSSASKLKLDALQFKDSAGALIQEYRFSYWTTSFSWNSGSMSMYTARDLWGYYNGATQNTDLVLQQTVQYQDTPATPVGNVTIGGAVDRNVNTSLAKEGVLKKIEFPTGGFSEFNYESHRYLDAGNVKYAGGIRVTTITTKESSTAPAITKTYRYGSGESGYGVANFNTSQFNYNTSQHQYQSCPVSPTLPTLDYRIRTYHSNSAFTQDGFDSSPVRYPFVTEYIGDPSTTRIGKIIYEFEDFGDVDQVVPSSGKFYRNSFAWKRGKLKNKSTYDSLNQKVVETVVAYTPYKVDNGKYIGLGVHGFINENAGSCPIPNCTNEVGEPVGAQTFMFTKYYQGTGAYLESSVTEYTYERGNPSKFVTKTTSTTYHAEKIQPKQITVTRSANQPIVTVNTYPFELAANASSTGNAKGIYKLNTKNILTSPVETYTYLVQGTNNVISGQVTTFLECAANANFVVPDKVLIWESLNPVSTSSYTPLVINGGNNGVTPDTRYKERINMIAYDNAGNIQTVAKTDDARVTYLWGYSNARLVAQVTNADLNMVAYSSFESDGKGNWSYSGPTYSDIPVKTGSRYYRLAGGSITRSLPTGTYKLEYWAKAPVTLTGGTITDIRTSPADANGWILYEKQVVMTTTTTLTLSGSTYIDELRVYPSNAQMTTYTYDPIYGITSITDPAVFTTYYEYDTYGRLKFIKDKDGFIQKVNQYNYKFK